MKSEKRSLIWELVIATGSLLIIFHALFLMRHIAVIGRSISTVVAILLLYVPVIVLWKRGRSVDFIDRSGKSVLMSGLTFVVASVVVFPPFLLCAHFWQIIVMGKGSFAAVAYPQWLNVTLYQLLLVSLPEEFYFRGYFQSTIDRAFPRRWRFLGVDVGPGWIVTAAAFAVAHTIVAYQWWHFGIFFPALLFGYLRLRTGSITAPILFHAASNILMDWFARCYS